jgi:hypothetical protein
LGQMDRRLSISLSIGGLLLSDEKDLLKALFKIGRNSSHFHSRGEIDESYKKTGDGVDSGLSRF